MGRPRGVIIFVMLNMCGGGQDKGATFRHAMQEACLYESMYVCIHARDQRTNREWKISACAKKTAQKLASSSAPWWWQDRYPGSQKEQQQS